MKKKVSVASCKGFLVKKKNANFLVGITYGKEWFRQNQYEIHNFRQLHCSGHPKIGGNK